MLYNHLNSLTSVNLKNRVFSKVPGVAERGKRKQPWQGGRSEKGNSLCGDLGRVLETAVEMDPLAHLAADANSVLVLADARVRDLFGLMTRDLCRPLQDFEVSSRPPEMRSLMEQAYGQHAPVFRNEVSWSPLAQPPRWLDVEIVPIYERSDALLGGTLTFLDITNYKTLRKALEQSKRDLELAYEELQSTNEEGEAKNRELNDRTEALEHLNRVLESILGRLPMAIIVLGQDTRVQMWSQPAEELWGLRQDEVTGKRFAALDIGLPVEQFGQAIRACLSGDRDSVETSVPATNRRGQAVLGDVVCRHLRRPDRQIAGVLLMISAQPGRPSGDASQSSTRSAPLAWRPHEPIVARERT